MGWRAPQKGDPFNMAAWSKRRRTGQPMADDSHSPSLQLIQKFAIWPLDCRRWLTVPSKARMHWTSWLYKVLVGMVPAHRTLAETS